MNRRSSNARKMPTMKTILAISFCVCASLSGAQDKGIDSERLMSKDANKDGKISKEELGEKLWIRAVGQDADGDGLLDAKEIAALQAKGKGTRKGEGAARPGGANLSFQVREFKGSNGHTLRTRCATACSCRPPSTPDRSRSFSVCMARAGTRPRRMCSRQPTASKSIPA
jgi:hypothetical protein